MDSLAFPHILEAAQRIAPWVHRTPVLQSAWLDEHCGCRLFFKCENFQKAGAFKARGAHNAVFLLGRDSAQRGVATHSSGNHAAALALAARRRGIAAHVVMPSNAPAIKRRPSQATAESSSNAHHTRRARSATRDLVARTAPSSSTRMTTIASWQGKAPPRSNSCNRPGSGIRAGAGRRRWPAGGTATAVQGTRSGIRVIGSSPRQQTTRFFSFRSGVLTPVGAAATIADGLRASLGAKVFRW